MKLPCPLNNHIMSLEMSQYFSSNKFDFYFSYSAMYETSQFLLFQIITSKLPYITGFAQPTYRRSDHMF